MGWYGYGFRPYVSVAQRRANALRHVEKLKKKGQAITPVQIDGRAIAKTFWGKAWCDHLESYSDYANRLPRGRTYVRNGSVVDLQIAPGKVTAIVSGSEIYHVNIAIKPLKTPRWSGIKTRCAGRISSVLELLQGRLDNAVMEVITARDEGLFPAPAEISLDCSCPDWADMCKHVAAVLYGVGARLDHEPELLFKLRQVDHLELIEEAVAAESLAPSADAGRKTLAETELADVFGIELDQSAPVVASPTFPEPATPKQRGKIAKPAPTAVAPGKPATGKITLVRPKEKKGKPRPPARSATPRPQSSIATQPIQPSAAMIRRSKLERVRMKTGSAERTHPSLARDASLP